jgi:hypothetical protein
MTPSRGGISALRSTPSSAVLEAVTAGECERRSGAEIFDAVWRLAGLGRRLIAQTPPRKPAACRTCSKPGCAAPNRPHGVAVPADTITYASAAFTRSANRYPDSTARLDK